MKIAAKAFEAVVSATDLQGHTKSYLDALENMKKVQDISIQHESRNKQDSDKRRAFEKTDAVDNVLSTGYELRDKKQMVMDKVKKNLAADREKLKTLFKKNERDITKVKKEKIDLSALKKKVEASRNTEAKKVKVDKVKLAEKFVKNKPDVLNSSKVNKEVIAKKFAETKKTALDNADKKRVSVETKFKENKSESMVSPSKKEKTEKAFQDNKKGITKR